MWTLKITGSINIMSGILEYLSMLNITVAWREQQWRCSWKNNQNSTGHQILQSPRAWRCTRKGNKYEIQNLFVDAKDLLEDDDEFSWKSYPWVTIFWHENSAKSPFSCLFAYYRPTGRRKVRVCGLTTNLVGMLAYSDGTSHRLLDKYTRPP